MTSTLKRLAMPALGLAAAASFATACSGSSVVGNGSNGASIGAASAGSSSGDFGGSGSASTPVSSGSAPGASASSGGNGGSDAAFCTTFRDELSTIQNAGADPTAAARTFDALLKVAPPAEKDDLQFIDSALHGGLSGKTADLTKVRDASVRVTKYFVTNCH